MGAVHRQCAVNARDGSSVPRREYRRSSFWRAFWSVLLASLHNLHNLLAGEACLAIIYVLNNMLRNIYRADPRQSSHVFTSM